MKTILVDAVDAFVIEENGSFHIFEEMHSLLESFPNKKIILAGANDEQAKEFGLDQMPYDVFSLKHNPEKTNSEYYQRMLKHFGLKASNVVYFEHNPKAVESAQSIGIQSYYYDPQKRDLKALKQFLTENAGAHVEKEVVQVPVVAGAVIKRNGKYLLVQEKQPKAYGLWNFPAGRVDVGDTIEQTAIKEAKEETGYRVKLIKKIGIFQETATEPPKHAFEAKIVSGELKFPKDELLGAHWFTRKEIQSMEPKLRGSWITHAIDLLEKK